LQVHVYESGFIPHLLHSSKLLRGSYSSCLVTDDHLPGAVSLAGS